MFKLLITISILLNFATAKIITPNDVYSQVMLIDKEIHFLLKYHGLEHNHDEIIKSTKIKTKLKPRTAWQKTYEIMIKINILRKSHNMPIIEPNNIEPILSLNPDMVYEQTQRILTELKIIKYKLDIENVEHNPNKYSNKTPQDVFNELNHISASLDTINKTVFTPSYVFGEAMRVYDDLTTILNYLNIKDHTIPTKHNSNTTPLETFSTSMEILNRIRVLQRLVSIETVNFSSFKKKNPNPSDVFTMVQMILSELQTIKAYIGLFNYITPGATTYHDKTPADVDQLMNWNLRKILLIDTLGVK